MDIDVGEPVDDLSPDAGGTLLSVSLNPTRCGSEGSVEMSGFFLLYGRKSKKGGHMATLRVKTLRLTADSVFSTAPARTVQPP